MIQRRNTPQRLKVLNYLKSVCNHPNAKMVYDGIKKDMPNVSLATVYRNLQLLSKEGKILKFEVNNEARFDGDSCCHQHLICKKCGKIIDMFDKDLAEYAMMRITNKNFVPEKVTIIVKGNCTKCEG